MAKEPNQSSSNKRPFENLPNVEYPTSRNMIKTAKLNKVRQRESREKKGKAWREDASTVEKMCAGLDGVEKVKAQARLAEQGALMQSDRFYYRATIFLREGIGGTSSLKTKLTFEQIWKAFVEFVINWRGEGEATLMLQSKENFRWMLIGFVSPLIGYRIADIGWSERGFFECRMDDRPMLAQPEMPEISTSYKPNAQGNKLLRKLGWEQFKDRILDSASIEPKSFTELSLKRPAPEWVKVELTNAMGYGPLPNKSGKEISTDTMFLHDLAQLRELAKMGKPLPVNKTFHPYFEKEFLHFGRVASLGPEEEAKMKNAIKKETSFNADWRFAGIRLNTEALEKWLAIELHDTARHECKFLGPMNAAD